MSENIFDVSPTVSQGLAGIDPLNRLRAEAQIARMRNQYQTETLDMRDRQAQSDITQRRRNDVIESPTVRESAEGARRLGELDPNSPTYLQDRNRIIAENPGVASSPEASTVIRAQGDQWAVTERERAEQRDMQRRQEQEERSWIISKQRQAEEFATKLLLEDPDLQDDYADLLAGNGGDPIAAAMDTQRIANSRKYNMVLRQMGVPESELARFGPRDQRMITTDDYLDIIAELQQKEASMEMDRRESLLQQGYTPRDPDFYPPPEEGDSRTPTKRDFDDRIEALQLAVDEADGVEKTNLEQDLAKVRKERTEWARSNGAQTRTPADPTGRYLPGGNESDPSRGMFAPPPASE